MLQSDQYLLSHCETCPILGVISQQPKEYCSHCKSETGRWKSTQNCILYIWKTLWYNKNSKTQLEPKFWVHENVEPAQKLLFWWDLVFWCGETHCNSSGSVPTRNWNRTWNLELLLTVITTDCIIDSWQLITSRWNRILIISNCLTNIVINLPCRLDIHSPKLQEMICP